MSKNEVLNYNSEREGEKEIDGRGGVIRNGGARERMILGCFLCSIFALFSSSLVIY